MNKEVTTYDIYVDASIYLPTKTACAGCLVVNRATGKTESWYLVEPNGTNNSAEIIGIWMAVYSAVYIQGHSKVPFMVNVFSDSRISLLGVREWLPRWITNRDEKGNLINTTGIVANQQWFLDIFNMICISGIKMKFFHQKGHVSLNSPKRMIEAERLFFKINNCTLDSIGLGLSAVSSCNDFVDKSSRKRAYEISTSNKTPSDYHNTLIVPVIPMAYDTNEDMIDVYLNGISGGVNSYLINSMGV